MPLTLSPAGTEKGVSLLPGEDGSQDPHLASSGRQPEKGCPVPAGEGGGGGAQLGFAAVGRDAALHFSVEFSWNDVVVV